MTLKEIMLDVKAPPAARIGAATAILRSRASGEPGQAVDIAVVHDLKEAERIKQLEELEHLVAMIELPSLAQGQELEDPPEHRRSASESPT